MKTLVKTLAILFGLAAIVVLTHATGRVGNPYTKSAASYYALPPVHTRNHEEMVALVRQLYPNLDDPVGAIPQETAAPKHHHYRMVMKACSQARQAGCTTWIGGGGHRN
jgi:hypothetical protein